MASLKKRGDTFYAQYYIGTKQKRVCLDTDSLQIAKEKLRQLESNLARGIANPLSTRTPIGEVLDAYVKHIRAHKTPKSAQTEIYYLREAFGAVCDGLKVTSRTLSEKARKRPLRPDVDHRRRLARIEVNHIEDLTTANVSGFIGSLVAARGLAPKTANHYRQILTRVCNWAMKEHGIRLPADRNPAAAVKRYHEEAPSIRFLTLEQIDSQLKALTLWPQLKTMVAVYIYAGLRREEALWLQAEDIDLSAGANGMIRIHAKEVGGRFWQPKTRRNRAVPISSALRACLERWTPPKSDHGWYFPSPEGHRYDPDNFSQDLRAAQAETKLPYACLDFRHRSRQLAMTYRHSSLDTIGSSHPITHW